jgi:hypothetical protein
MNIQYVVKINEADETNPYTLYNRKNNGKAQTIQKYPKTEYKYDKYHIIKYSKGNDIIYLVKNPDETPQVFLAICYDTIDDLFKDFQEIKNADVPNHISIIKKQYIEPYLLFLLAQSVGKTISDKVITDLEEKKQKAPRAKLTHYEEEEP